MLQLSSQVLRVLKFLAAHLLKIAALGLMARAVQSMQPLTLNITCSSTEVSHGQLKGVDSSEEAAFPTGGRAWAPGEGVPVILAILLALDLLLPRWKPPQPPGAISLPISGVVWSLQDECGLYSFPLFSRAWPDQMPSRRYLSRCPWMYGLYLGFFKL